MEGKRGTFQVGRAAGVKVWKRGSQEVQGPVGGQVLLEQRVGMGSGKDRLAGGRAPVQTEELVLTGCRSLGGFGRKTLGQLPNRVVS